MTAVADRGQQWQIEQIGVRVRVAVDFILVLFDAMKSQLLQSSVARIDDDSGGGIFTFTIKEALVNYAKFDVVETNKKEKDRSGPMPPQVNVFHCELKDFSTPSGKDKNP